MDFFNVRLFFLKKITKLHRFGLFMANHLTFMVMILLMNFDCINWRIYVYVIIRSQKE